MKIAAVSLLALLVAAMSHAQQPVIIDGGAMLPSLVPLFISCDLQEEFLTPAIDARTLFWMETPVSRDGARMRAELNRQWKVSQVPLVLNSETAKRCEARPRSFRTDWCEVERAGNQCERARGCGLCQQNGCNLAKTAHVPLVRKFPRVG